MSRPNKGDLKFIQLISDLIRCQVNDEYDQVMQMLTEKPLYRVELSKKAITTVPYTLLENFAPELQEVYSDIQDLPKWAQEKLAVLMVLDPTKVNDEIHNVGRRINANVFWVYGNERNS
jgi:hypothetical protein